MRAHVRTLSGDVSRKRRGSTWRCFGRHCLTTKGQADHDTYTSEEFLSRLRAAYSTVFNTVELRGLLPMQLSGTMEGCVSMGDTQTKAPNNHKDIRTFGKDGHLIYWGDAVTVLEEKVPDESADLIFADPPYSIGKKFANFCDKWPSEVEYAKWCESWLELCIAKLKASWHPLRYGQYPMRSVS